MKFDIKSGNLIQSKHCVIVGVYEEGIFTESAEKLDKLSHGYIKNILKKGGLPGKPGQVLPLYGIPHLPAELVLLVGCGNHQSLSETLYEKIVSNAIKAANNLKVADIIFFLAELPIEKRKIAWKIKYAAEVTANTLYTFDEFKSKKQAENNLKTITFAISEKNEVPVCEIALKEARAIINGIELSKNLANLPSNICTPIYLAEQAKKLAKKNSHIKIKIHGRKEMEKLGMGAFLAVAKGSAQDPRLICVEYKGTTKKSPTIALVGKGITFDTGGISLKPADGMVGMKYDMCGAATVLGTIKAAAELKLPIHIVGILATAENMPSGTACKPEDIVTTLSGQTVEIMNTDAEGRLVLCDALTYCERYQPDIVIDIATLTGAVVIALGKHATGLLSNNDTLAQDLLKAGTESHDRAWQLPLWEEYQDQLKSPFADMSNTGGRAAGTITAACFLSRFAKKFHWAHLDVAGTAAMMIGGNDRYATGRPIPMLMQYLINKCGR